MAGTMHVLYAWVFRRSKVGKVGNMPRKAGSIVGIRSLRSYCRVGVALRVIVGVVGDA